MKNDTPPFTFIRKIRGHLFYVHTFGSLLRNPHQRVIRFLVK